MKTRTFYYQKPLLVYYNGGYNKYSVKAPSINALQFYYYCKLKRDNRMKNKLVHLIGAFKESAISAPLYCKRMHELKRKSAQAQYF